MDKLVLSLATLGSIVLVVHGTVESPIVIGTTGGGGADKYACILTRGYFPYPFQFLVSRGASCKES